MSKKEYAFEARLNAVVRVVADSVDAARKAAMEVVDAVDTAEDMNGGYIDKGVTVTEFSITSEDGEVLHLLEVDGEEV